MRNTEIVMELEASDCNHVVTYEPIFKYLSEYDNKHVKLIHIAIKMTEYLNYPIFNTFTAFGNPDYKFLEGYISGAIDALNGTWDKNIDKHIIRIGRIKMIFPKPYSNNTIVDAEMN